MNRKAVVKVSHNFKESQCCVCSQERLGQFTNVKENFVNVRGNLVSYITILETTLNYQHPVDDNLEICESCKNTIIPFYLLKLKFDESNRRLPVNPFEYQNNPNVASYTEDDEMMSQFMHIKQEFDSSIETSRYEESETVPITTKPKKKKSRPDRIQWIEKNEFLSYEEAIDYVKTQKIWSVKHTKPISKSGEKRQYFRCNLVPKAQPRQCSSVMALVTKANGSTLMLHSGQVHDHSKICKELQTE